MGKIGPQQSQCYTTHSIEFLCQFFSNNKVIRINPWLYLVQSTTQLISHSSTEFKGHFFWSKRVMRMNPRVYLIQSTATVILHISTEFQGAFCSIKELLERTHGSKAPSMSFYTSPLRSNDIILEMKELFKYITKFQGDLSQNKSSTEFHGHFSGNKRVLRMKPSIKLV